MTKRRAEDILVSDASFKRCFRSLCSVDTQLAGMHVVKDAGPPSLLTLIGSRCRKRPHYFEDLQPEEIGRQQKKTSTNRMNSADAENVVNNSGRFRDANKTSVYSLSCSPMASKKRAREETQQDQSGTLDKVADQEDDDLCTFNSFQYWRDPLPELDLSLLQSDTVSEPGGAHPPKPFEAMET